MFDVITIGSATQDIFIESNFAEIHEVKDANSSKSLLCFDYSTKIEVEQTALDVGGGAVNSAVNFANLGYKAATIVKTGKDINGEAVLRRLKEKEVDSSLILQTDDYKTGFSVILTSFEGDRTVLAHRGANSHISLDEIPWDDIKKSKWIYIAPLSGNSNLVLDKIADFAEENGVSMAFNPGTTQIKRGVEDLKKVVSTAEVLIMNKSEAFNITGMQEGHEQVYQKPGEFDPWSHSVHEMLFRLKTYKPKVVVITDGSKGVIAFDGETFYHAPAYPAKVISTLGAGDAFSSTFVASLMRFNWDIEKAIIFASINSASIVESFGAQSGLKSFAELEKIYQQNEDFKITKKSKQAENIG
ncbi:MAG: hypothetical protein A2287_07650 [Candidatus Melainabacteria bacterium RIFOXYA12_FULL_32_12]|nr:MAG: hypothetical protein A2255_07680 [Candidatus Melainabacteria bacterium RIFOXYA2_FULL_32_9]OGI30700.1 MAG: hypothetical protein A2287_07650 [Candidatus Melainabacteria bacterium RIFOXYA12_FULL_32_12]